MYSIKKKTIFLLFGSILLFCGLMFFKTDKPIKPSVDSKTSFAPEVDDQWIKNEEGNYQLNITDKDLIKKIENNPNTSVTRIDYEIHEMPNN